MHPLLVAMEELQTKPCSGFLTGRGPSAHVPTLDLHEWVYSSPQTSAVDAVINPTAQKEELETPESNALKTPLLTR